MGKSKIGRPKTHGQRQRGVKKSKEYVAWDHMLRRCLNPRYGNYKNYGARGISVCDRWKSYENFIADVGPAPGKEYSLDRINNDGNYEPGNVRWTDGISQQSNRRDNVTLEYNGETKTLSMWSRELGIPKTTISGRMKKGWPADKALSKIKYTK